MRTLILADNARALEFSRELNERHGDIDIYQSPNGPLGDGIPRLDVRLDTRRIIEQYTLVLSIHCKQIFPAGLVRGVRCVNVHPGYNPYNRGWFPQVFSIINGMPAGVTIHEIDEQLDHGAIIAQRRYEIKSWDTSGSAYAAILEIEREILLEYFPAILSQSYSARRLPDEGNLNLRRDFETLRRIDLDRRGTYGEVLNHLRALTHGDFRNAYFVNADGRKVFVRVVLEPEDP